MTAGTIHVASHLSGKSASSPAKAGGASASRSGPTNVGPEIIEHWYVLVAAQQFSSKEFYDGIENDVKAQGVPSLKVSRVDLAEGGVLSEKREYLRFKRERLTFDVCAAPVGVNFFFSYRFYDEPAAVEPWQILVLIMALMLCLNLSMRYVGLLLGPAALLAICGVSAWTMRNAIGLGMRDLDATLINTPVIGPIYERFFRQDTYYRQDVRLAYCSIVSGIVKQRVEAITAAKGINLIREHCYSPVFEGLYSAKQVPVQANPAT